MCAVFAHCRNVFSSVWEREEADMIVIRGVISEGCSVPGHVAVFGDTVCRFSWFSAGFHSRVFFTCKRQNVAAGMFWKRTALLDKQDNNTASAVINVSNSPSTLSIEVHG